jgi:carbamoyl-phosphate synthase large subunit
MKSVGEVMSIGRTFCEALQKAARSLETGGRARVAARRVDYRALAEPKKQRDLAMDAPELDARASPATDDPDERRARAREARRDPDAPTASSTWPTRCASGITDASSTSSRPSTRGFSRRSAASSSPRRRLKRGEWAGAETRCARYKRLGFSDRQIASSSGRREDDVRALRRAQGRRAVYARVDTCAAEFVAHTPYLYSTYETESEAQARREQAQGRHPRRRPEPHRAGDRVRLLLRARRAWRSASSASRPSWSTATRRPSRPTTTRRDRLYFEPLTLEDVLAICDEEKPEGVIVQFGGQTPLKLAVPLEKRGVKLLGTSADAIDRAEDRGRFDELLTKLALKRPRSGIARTARRRRHRDRRAIGYPVLVRPSYVLGGRAMMIAYARGARGFVERAFEAARDAGTQTILVDEFLKDAIEVDVDCVADGKRCVIGGVMQHIEEAGVHSGDSSSVLPPHSLPRDRALASRSRRACSRWSSASWG